ncbi:MAG TPA: carboxypeptidase regulatory-like domain-containing protein [Polyangia bacterium]
MKLQAVRGLVLVAALVGCSGTPAVMNRGDSRGAGGAGVGNAGSGGANGGGGPVIVLPTADGGGPAPSNSAPCEKLSCQQTNCQVGACQQKACASGGKTTLKGKVFDPAGKVPLYNVLVYVPNAPLDPIETGPSCDRCDKPVSGKPVAWALTDTKGGFVMDNVPVGTDIPLVIQVGKWRREVTVPKTEACAETVFEDPQVMRLPRKQSEGNIPKIALATGMADRLECLLRKMGIDDSEFTTETGNGRINFFAGRGGSPSFAPTHNGGATFTPATMFWNDPAAYDRYDLVILSCEGNQYIQDKPLTAREALVAYANKGGRVFASHWHNVWLEDGPAPWSEVATFSGRNVSLPDPYATNVDTSFPKGAALAEWLVNVGASMTSGQLELREAKRTVEAINPMYTRRWIYNASMMPSPVQYFTFNTPAGAEMGKECGRTVFTDIHVSAGDQGGAPFPTGCVTTDLSPQEKALEFMLFDLSSCLQPDDKPQPPVIP